MFDTTPTSRSGRCRAFALAALAVGSIVVGAPRTAHAEDVSPDGKGIAGGALLGGEVVVFIEALAGVRSSTAYVLGAGGGAVAGGIAGHFVEQGVDDGRVPAYMLASGLALIIPALVVTLDQTRYLPAEGARQERPVQTPPSDPGKPGGAAVIGAEPAPAPAAPAPAPAPTTPSPGGGTAPKASAPLSLFNVRGGNFKVGLPVPEVRPVFSASQKRSLGVEGAGSEVRFPVVGLTF